MPMKLTGLLLLVLTAAAGWFALAPDSPAPALDPLACALPESASEQPGMVWVPGGDFIMGSAEAYREEYPAHQNSVEGFWMDRTEVTNAQFAEFVEATGYVTLAERGILDPAAPEAPPRPGSAVFVAPEEGNYDPFTPWWQFVDGASWREPQGPGSGIEGLERHPVVHIAYEDAVAYADWKGRKLPTEAQFEYAAKGDTRIDAAGEHVSNTWQGYFPFENEPEDGYIGSAPVGCYTANRYGLYDLLGNAWEWTASPYYLGHDYSATAEHPNGYDPAQPLEDAVAVIKGGSFLCADNYCMRYRPEARQGQSLGLGTSHIGFRTVLQAPPPDEQ